jgi:hypothetical protein
MVLVCDGPGMSRRARARTSAKPVRSISTCELVPHLLFPPSGKFLRERSALLDAVHDKIDAGRTTARMARRRTARGG